MRNEIEEEREGINSWQCVNLITILVLMYMLSLARWLQSD